MSGNDLDRFMMACSDLNQPARSRPFQSRLGLKDIKVQPRPAVPPAAFQTSERARDWSQLDLGDAFSQSGWSALHAPAAASAPNDAAAVSDLDEFAEFQSCLPPSLGTSSHAVDSLNDALSPAPTAAPAQPVLLSDPLSQRASRPAGQSVAPPRSSQSALQSSWAAADVASCSDAGAGYLPPAESAPFVAHTPVQSVLPAAKPTRFRQGLVPLTATPGRDVLVVDKWLSAVDPARSPGDRRQGVNTEEVLRLSSLGSAPLSGADTANVTAFPGTPLTTNEAGAQPPAPAGDTGTPGVWPVVPLSASRAPSGSAPVPVANRDLLSSALDPAVDDFSTPLAPLQLQLGSLSTATGPAEGVDEDFGEFVCVERPAASGASSRHGSLPSLDLQVAAAAEAGEVSPLEVDRRDTDGEPPPAKQADRYDSFRQEMICPTTLPETTLVTEWRRCLQACCQLIEEGISLFGSVADQRTCSEVASSRQGARYLHNLGRVYRVADRIERACERHSCLNQLELLLSETCKAWANLTAFVANSSSLAALEGRDCHPEVAAGPPVYCGVCLLPVDEAASDESTLTCAGHQYHACCANLWVNRVADVLPALRL